jgi:transposase
VPTGIPSRAPVCYCKAMLDDASKLPDDPADLKDLVTRLASELKNRDIKIAKLEHELAGHRRHRFGSKSETMDQLALQLEEEEIAAAKDAPPSSPDKPAEPKDKPRRKPLPADLPRNEEVLSPGEACDQCGGRLKTLGEDVTEELEYVPGHFVVNRFVRPRMACACCEKIVQAPLPSRPIERGRPGPGLLAHVLVSKYADHLPFCDRAGLVNAEHPTSRSILLSVVGVPPQDAYYGGREAP